MHLRTVINLAIGSILFILLLVTIGASFITKKSLEDLYVVVEQNVPTLRILLKSNEYLNNANIAFDRFAQTTPVYQVDLLADVKNIRWKINELAKSGGLHQEDNEIALRCLDTIARFLKESTTDNTAGKNTLVAENASTKKECDYHFNLIGKVLQRWSHQVEQSELKDKQSRIAEISRQLNALEDDLKEYYALEMISLEDLLALLEKCLNNLKDLMSIILGPSSHFLEEDKVRLEELQSSLHRYRSAVVLFYDEKELGVAGANLDEIMSHVKKAQNNANTKYSELNTAIIEYINVTQHQIISSNYLLQKFFLASSVFSIFFVIVVLLGLKNILSMRINKLIYGSRKFANGDLEYRMSTEPEGDEFSRLAQAFNTMADTLRHREIEKNEHLETLARSQKMESIGMMAGGVAHDLNNILSGIVSYPDLLLIQLEKDSELRGPIETIRKSGIQAADIVDDLLTFARGVASSKVTVNIHNIIHEYIDSLEHKKLSALFPQISLLLQCDKSPLYISCSETHVKKCLMNILYNAFEAITGKGSCVLSTTAQTIDIEQAKRLNIGPGKYALVSITDSGSGISENDINHIFEPFYTKKIMGRSGTGLGLAIVWNSMLDHKGIVTVKSNENGTVFTLYFPMDDSVPSAEIEDTGVFSLAGSGETVLVVDDQAQLREIANQILTSLNYKVVMVQSGEEAIIYLRTHSVDIVLLDMFMEPGMDGLQTYRQIIKIHPGQKAIIVSGYSENKSVRDAFKIGVGGFVKKPFSVKTLGHAIQKELTK